MPWHGFSLASESFERLNEATNSRVLPPQRLGDPVQVLGLLLLGRSRKAGAGAVERVEHQEAQYAGQGAAGLLRQGTLDQAVVAVEQNLILRWAAGRQVSVD